MSNKIDSRKLVAAASTIHEKTLGGKHTPQSEHQSKAHNAVKTALSNFDTLPSCGFVRISVVMALLGVSASSVWRLVAANTIKAYKHTPRTTSFNVGELRALLATKAVK